MRSIRKLNTILGILAFILCNVLAAQTIVEAEYYIDGDPGFGNGTPIDISSPSEIVNLDIDLPIDTEPGIHSFYIRTKSDLGLWSISDYRIFKAYVPISTNMVEAEYYIDADPGFGNGTPISFESGSEVNLEAELSTLNIDPGIHLVGFRIKNDQGRWSLVDIRTFRVFRSAQVSFVAAEYFIGEDPGVGNGTPVPISNDGNNATINAPVDISGLELGEYVVYVRGLNQNGSWSLHEVIPFTICETFGATSVFEIIQFNNTVSFINNSQYAESYQWSFGDGEISDAEEPAHFYNQPGVYEITLISTNECGADTSSIEITINSVDAITTNKGGQGAIVTSSITGNGFEENSIVILCKSDNEALTLTPDTVFFTSSHVLIVVLNLSSAELGFYDVKVINETDTLILIEGYEVIDRIAPELDIYITGPAMFRPNRYVNFNITIVNNGNVDALLVPVNIGNIPWSDEDGEMNFDVLSGTYIDPRDTESLNESVTQAISEGVDSLFFLTPMITDSSNTRQYLNAVIPSLPPGSNSFQVTFYANQDSQSGPEGDICITGTVSPPYIKNEPSPTASDCAATIMDCAIKIALELTPGGDAIDCIKDVLSTISGLSGEYVGIGVPEAVATGFTGGQVQAGAMSQIGSTTSASASAVSAFFTCGSTLLGTVIPWTKFGRFAKIAAEIAQGFVVGANNTLTLGGCVVDSYNACTNQDENGGRKQTFKKLRTMTSHDPNAKTGPGIVGDNYINGFTTMAYTIQFENIDSADAAAQIVIIIDSLDVSKFDLSTFRFIDYGFGNIIIPVTTESNTFTDILDLRPTMPNLLRIDAMLDTLTGIVIWEFTTLDTLTMSLTNDPFDGFLPPNVDSPEGQGFVSFGIELNESVQSGDIIENNSIIIFDTNEPIVTNIWDNGFDDVNPSSQVSPLPAIINDTIFNITWSGTDDASGVRWYDIYASKNDEEYQLIVSHSEDITMFLIGEYGDNYKFYSIATDKAGNVEEAPTSFDAETTLEMPNSIWEEEKPTSWLAQNFPNPTDGVTTIVYSIDGSQDITLVLEDMLSRPVKILDRGLRQGRIEINENLSELASGIYYLTLYTDNEQFTRKLILNR